MRAAGQRREREEKKRIEEGRTLPFVAVLCLERSSKRTEEPDTLLLGSSSALCQVEPFG
jgi:hypothetical protein